ncbi:MAG: Spy/CpxP family protein refolding chaperone [Candidatus Gastranaerophilales bacterium]|nr:Spy/CpxP family protein refolding chaperone [Candidatus Gastranaerophilales bacterium]
MKKIIFLLCFIFMVSPVFSMENDAVKEEVKRVKLEAKQKVEQIKAEARAAKIKAKADAKQAKIDARNAQINARREAKLAQKTEEFNSKTADIKAKNDARKALIIEAAKAKKDKIDAVTNAKLAKIEEQNTAALLALKAKYEGNKIAPSEKTVKAKQDETKAAMKDTAKDNKAEKVADKKTKTETDKKAESDNKADNKILPVSELKPRVTEKRPAVHYTGVNFETKKTEIMDELKLSEKQKASAEKLYEKNKAEIAEINVQMETLQNEMKAIKKADLDTKFKERQLLTIEDKMSALYQERDSVHNAAMKKFDGILDDEQQEIWLNIKTKGARLFPDIEMIKQ